MKTLKIASFTAGVALAAYLSLAPVAVDPVAWQSPENPGYTGPFAQNQHLSQLQRIELNGDIGPEDLAMDAEGWVYFSLLGGDINRIDQNNNIESWVNTGGRPLGIEFDGQGNLIVADALKGLLSISPDKQITVLLQNVDGIDVRYADDVDIAENGKIYLSDASIKFHADVHGTYGASLLDINEHGGQGRLIEFDPATGTANTLLDGLNFANGVAMSHDQSAVLINETGTYRVLKVDLMSEQRGQVSVVIDNLPGFPDNLAQGNQGLYWVGLVSPRSAALDALSEYPTLRKVVQRLPAFMRPKAQHFGHVIAINESGEVVHNLQDPLGMYGQTTGALEVGDKLYVSSLHETALAITENPNVSISLQSDSGTSADQGNKAEGVTAQTSAQSSKLSDHQIKQAVELLSKGQQQGLVSEGALMEAATSLYQKHESAAMAQQKSKQAIQDLKDSEKGSPHQGHQVVAE